MPLVIGLRLVTARIRPPQQADGCAGDCATLGIGKISDKSVGSVGRKATGQAEGTGQDRMSHRVGSVSREYQFRVTFLTNVIRTALGNGFDCRQFGWVNCIEPDICRS